MRFPIIFSCRLRVYVVLTLALLITSCSQKTGYFYIGDEKPKKVNQEQLLSYRSQGSITIREQGSISSARFDWKRNKNDYSLLIHGPLNVGFLRFTGTWNEPKKIFLTKRRGADPAALDEDFEFYSPLIADFVPEVSFVKKILPNLPVVIDYLIKGQAGGSWIMDLTNTPWGIEDSASLATSNQAKIRPVYWQVRYLDWWLHNKSPSGRMPRKIRLASLQGDLWIDMVFRKHEL